MDKNLIDNTITKKLKPTCENEELITKIYESAADSMVVAPLQDLLQFHGIVLDTLKSECDKLAADSIVVAQLQELIQFHGIELDRLKSDRDKTAPDSFIASLIELIKSEADVYLM